MIPLLLQFAIAVVALGIILWGGDGLLALFPGYDRLKKGIKIVVIVVVALWCLSLLAQLLGVGMPWGSALPRHR